MNSSTAPLLEPIKAVCMPRHSFFGLPSYDPVEDGADHVGARLIVGPDVVEIESNALADLCHQRVIAERLDVTVEHHVRRLLAERRVVVELVEAIRSAWLQVELRLHDRVAVAASSSVS